MNKLLIIGGTGTLGEALINKYSQHDITVISRDELKQWKLKQKYPNITFKLGDIRDFFNTKKLIFSIKPHIIILCAALKHIDICERNISECINTNIIGIKNVIDICNELTTIEKLLFISTDKACHPINVYGMCKSISERMMAEASLQNKHTKFLTVRYGNVLNSRGSIIPKFKELAENKDVQVLPVTSLKMTRFFMPLEDSINLIDDALNQGESGDTWIPTIYSFKIIDLAEHFAKIYNKTINIIGLRPGEKIHECLISDDEVHRTVRSGKYFIIKPCYIDSNHTDIVESYTSEKVSSKEDLVKLIENYIS